MKLTMTGYMLVLNIDPLLAAILVAVSSLNLIEGLVNLLF